MKFKLEKEKGLSLRVFNEHGQEVKAEDEDHGHVAWELKEGNYWLLRTKLINGKKFITITKVLCGSTSAEEVEQTVVLDETENFRNPRAIPLSIKGVI